MTWLWGLLAVVVGVAGIRYWSRRRSLRARRHVPRVDDAALRQILETGALDAVDDEPLDLDAAARAEEEFWSESWDEPEEYTR
jgi:hypothetical protein